MKPLKLLNRIVTAASKEPGELDLQQQAGLAETGVDNERRLVSAWSYYLTTAGARRLTAGPAGPDPHRDPPKTQHPLEAENNTRPDIPGLRERDSSTHPPAPPRPDDANTPLFCEQPDVFQLRIFLLAAFPDPSLNTAERDSVFLLSSTEA